MSDYSQGPGYWQASDGKWYPPQNDAPPAAAAYGQPQNPYAQPPQSSPGEPQQNPYGQAPNNPYGQAPNNPYGQTPYGQTPYGQTPYGEIPYGQPSSFGQPVFPAQGQPMFPGQGPGFPVSPSTGTSGLAVASFVLAIVWLCGVGSVLAIILGFIALGSIRGTAKSGKGLAIAGIVIGFVSIAITVIIVTTTAIFFKHAGDSVGTATEKKDFVITSCGLDETSKFATAVVTVTNHSGKTSDYWVEINFVDNGTIVDTGGGITFATTVDPGESAQIDVSGNKALTSAPACQIGQFDRFATTNVIPNIPSRTG